MAIIKVLKRENPYIQIDKIGVDDSNLSIQFIYKI